MSTKPISVSPNPSLSPTASPAFFRKENLLFAIVVIFTVGIIISTVWGMYYHQGFFADFKAVDLQAIIFSQAFILALAIILKNSERAPAVPQNGNRIKFTPPPAPLPKPVITTSSPIIQEPSAPIVKTPDEVPKNPQPKPTQPKPVITYLPLEEVKKERENVTWALAFSPGGQPSSPPPDSFPFLEEIKQKLPEPKWQPTYNIHRVKDTHLSYIKGILNGEIASLGANGKGISHPSQAREVFDYIKERLVKLLQNEKTISVEELLDKPLAPLKELLLCWENLLSLEQKDKLEKEDLALIKEISLKLPPINASLSKDYSVIINNIKNFFTGALASKPIPKDQLEYATQLSQEISGKLNIDFSLKTLEEMFGDAENAFLERLEKDIKKLLNTEEGPPFTQRDAFIIMKYLSQELHTLEKQIKASAKSIGATLENFSIQKIMSARFPQLENLMKLWENILEISESRIHFDAKVQLLQHVAEKLPDTDDVCWQNYSKIKKALIGCLAGLSESFSYYQVDVVPNRDSQKFLQDQNRKNQLQNAFDTITKKLGHDPIPLQVEMYTEDDALITATLQRQETEESLRRDRELAERLQWEDG